jgi:MFS family permease
MSDSGAEARAIAYRPERIPPLPIHIRWAAVVGIGVFLDGFTTLTVAAALTVLITTLHIDFARVGLLISASFCGMFVGAILFGAASERFGRRLIFIIAVALFGMLSILAAFAWDFSSLFWLRAIQGLGLGGAVPVAAALVAECLPARVRGKTFSLTYALLFALGYVLAPLAGLICIRLFGPQLGSRTIRTRRISAAIRPRCPGNIAGIAPLARICGPARRSLRIGANAGREGTRNRTRAGSCRCSTVIRSQSVVAPD